MQPPTQQPGTHFEQPTPSYSYASSSGSSSRYQAGPAAPQGPGTGTGVSPHPPPSATITRPSQQWDMSGWTEMERAQWGQKIAGRPGPQQGHHTQYSQLQYRPSTNIPPPHEASLVLRGPAADSFRVEQRGSHHSSRSQTPDLVSYSHVYICMLQELTFRLSFCVCSSLCLLLCVIQVGWTPINAPTTNVVPGIGAVENVETTSNPGDSMSETT